MNSRTVNINVAKTQGENANAEPVKLLKRIGSATVEITVHFSNTNKETLEDKLLRMIEWEVRENA